MDQSEIKRFESLNLNYIYHCDRPVFGVGLKFQTLLQSTFCLSNAITFKYNLFFNQPVQLNLCL